MIRNKRLLIVLLTVIMCLSAMPGMALGAAPSAPKLENYKTLYNTGDTVILSWNEVASAAAYKLVLSVYPYDSGDVILSLSTTKAGYASKSLPAGKYGATVYAIGADGQSSAAAKSVYFEITGGAAVSVTLPAKGNDAEVVPLAIAPVTQTFMWPVKDYGEDGSTSYAVTAMDIYYDGGKHGSQQNAIDINHDGWTDRYATREIVAAADGVVIDAYLCGHTGISCPKRSCVGSYIKIAHSIYDIATGTTTNYITAYVHLDPKTFTVKTGDSVTQGQVIARMGSTGNSSGIHLHFAIRDENNKDLPTLEFFMNDTYMPKISFMYFKPGSKGTVVATNGTKTRYSSWITDNYKYVDGSWVYAK